MTLLGGEIVLARENLKVLPWIKNPILLMLAMGFEPTTSQPLSGRVIPSLTHHLNHLGLVFQIIMMLQ